MRALRPPGIRKLSVNKNSTASSLRYPEQLFAAVASSSANVRPVAESLPESHEDGANKKATDQFFHNPLTIRTTAPPQPMETEPLESEEELDSSESGCAITAGQIRAVMGSISSLCLAATRKYLRERQVNRIVRSGGVPLSRPAWGLVNDSRQVSQRKSGRSRPSPDRYSPYSRPPAAARASEGLGVPEADTEDTPAPLLANISTICTELWEQAQRDRLHVPRAERTTVENMGHLLTWGDLVVMGPEGVDLEGDGDFDRSVMNSVLAAGKNLCRWLGYEEGVTWIENDMDF